MIYLDKLNSEEKKAIEELHTRIINDLPKEMLPMLEDAAILYRFLKARNFDVDKAEKMLRRTIAWRKHFQLETISEDFTPRPFFENYIKSSYLGQDKSGNLLIYIPLGVQDSRDTMKCVQINEYMRHWIWHFENTTKMARSLNRQHPDKSIQITGIFNLDKLTLGNATSKASVDECVRLLSILQDNYPESLNAIYTINAPGYYVFIWSILKSMMSSALVQKIHVYGYSGWKEKLLEIVDADVLPAFLGGNLTDPDGNPLCTTIVNHCGKIPETYYLPERERDFINRSLVKRIIVPSKQKKEITIHVAENGSRIHWEFLTKHKDIGFGLFRKMSDSNLEEILPIERYDTSDGVEKGSYKSRSNGNYVIVFDNSYSKLHSKEIDYCIAISKSAS